jgi:hypothetical protein
MTYQRKRQSASLPIFTFSRSVLLQVAEELRSEIADCDDTNTTSVKGST